MGLFFGKRTASYFERANFVISSDCGVVLNLQFMFRAGGGRSALLEVSAILRGSSDQISAAASSPISGLAGRWRNKNTATF
jgi:hypothetical protein